ncbi:uncharacterized protein BDR25DRAFT_342509 [Lindgomyces ingoldianus]|uniref:Uncharacterized protein n=1 Tax=Lindgomyces ingoldianus TaxID=673940 RepID=A0ACB6QXC6_9PLEO|nr:uncharacterized protein BDR25DRAFT_342509 [Lindgomyces ingoldianus]KAF2471160.1 hypothetical protein BDR25DRAFT_342509 [Lindgomyces ingoldianus]
MFSSPPDSAPKFGGPSRRPHTKPRKGCWMCRRRRIRCDETILQCRNCTKHQVRYNNMEIPLPTVRAPWEKQTSSEAHAVVAEAQGSSGKDRDLLSIWLSLRPRIRFRSGSTERDQGADCSCAGRFDTPGMIAESSGIRATTGLLTPTNVAGLTISTLVVPVAAVDPSGPAGQISLPIPRVAIGACIGIVLIAGGRASGAARSLLGPAMGVGSILFVMLRNDPAVKPEAAWVVFGAWSAATLAYLAMQCSRLVHANWYILVASVVTGICMVIIASAQRSSIQGGLVTAIPPCVAFASYAATFPFRERFQRSEDSVNV